MKIHSLLLLSSSLCLIASAESVRQGDAPLAGWLKSCTGTVKVRYTNGGDKMYAPGKYCRKLHVGDKVQVTGSGVGTLIIYNREVTIKATPKMIPIPARAERSEEGIDVLKKYFDRAGVERKGEITQEDLWRAINLFELENPKKSLVNVRMRLVPVGGNGLPLAKVPMVSSFMSLKHGDEFFLDIDNDSDMPVYATVMDTDCSVGVDRISPPSTEGQYPIPAHSHVRLPSRFFVELPDEFREGTEKLVLVASQKPIDLSILRTKDLKAQPDFESSSNDPLINLMQTAMASADIATPGDWNVSKVEFFVHRN